MTPCKRQNLITTQWVLQTIINTSLKRNVSSIEIQLSTQRFAIVECRFHYIGVTFNYSWSFLKHSVSIVLFYTFTEPRGISVF